MVRAAGCHTTHPANYFDLKKTWAAALDRRYLSRACEVPPEEIATPNDVLMFAHSGLSIAMGNAGREVQRAAHRATAANSEEGFARAVERFILHEPAETP
jgi:3-deoxy-D-manno-octulosonate 8-phosphate phosphatase KdsC-like HAD superfamily phosphatase